MSNYLKNIITPDFYDFLASNKAAYGDAVLSQLNDASEKISASTNEDECLAVVLSGYAAAIAAGSSYVENEVEFVTFSTDGILRRKIKFRCIESETYSENSIDFTSHLKSPFQMGITEAEMQSRIAIHPSAYTIASDFEEQTLTHGSLIIVRKIGDSFFIVNNISAPKTHFSPTGPGSSTRSLHGGGSKADTELENKYGLKRAKKVYKGIVPAYRGAELLNGSLPTDLLQVPDTRYWTKWGSGDGSVLKDYVASFNEMARAFHSHFGHKMRSSGIRSFRQQIINRKSGVRKGKCKDMFVPCTTAVPGRSNHGWGQAVDIRKPLNKECTGDACFLGYDKYHKWLLENAYKIGFAGIKWAWLGQKGTVMSTKSLKEPWHWEPINNRAF